MIYHLSRVILSLLLLMASTYARAYFDINIEQAESKINHMENKLNLENISVGMLSELMFDSDRLLKGLSGCVEYNKSKGESIEHLIENTGLSEDKDNTNILKLKKFQKEYYNKASKCILLKYKLQSQKETLEINLRKQKNKAWFNQSDLLFKSYTINWVQFKAFVAQHFQKKNFELALPCHGLLPICMLLFAVGLSIYAYFYALNRMFIQALLLFIFLQTLMLQVLFGDLSKMHLSTLLSWVALIFLILKNMMRKLTELGLSWQTLSEEDARRLNSWLWCAFILILPIVIYAYVMYDQKIELLDNPTYLWFKAIGSAIILGVLCNLGIKLLTTKIAKKRFGEVLSLLLRRIFIIFSLLPWLMIVGGYFILSTVFSWRALILMALVSYVLFFVKLINSVYARVNNPKYLLSQKLHKFFGIPLKQKIPEYAIIRAILIFNFVSRALFDGAELLGLPAYFTLAFPYIFLKTWYVFGFNIDIRLMLLATMVLCLIVQFGRVIAGLIIMNYDVKEYKSLRSMLIRLIQYLAFIIGLYAALNISNIDVSQFGLIIGALSVGIGFGLKNFAMDFMSGLLLMGSSNIAIGDYVHLEDNKGKIKHIGLLSSSIKTHEGVDVIIPNSFLLTRVVKNHTLKHSALPVHTHVRICNSKDILKAEKILLEVANSHDEIIKKGRIKPSVELTLKEGILLTLTCMIEQIDNKVELKNQLNHEILMQFNQHKIELR